MPWNSAGIGAIGGGISDLFAAQADRLKGQGDRFEAQNYDLAAVYADKEEAYTETSTAIKQMQQDRENYQALGQTTADVAGAGLAASGSALDILRDSASQGAMAKAVLGEQGLITEEGYKEQAQSYRTMADAANLAAHAEDQAAVGADITGGIKIAAGVFSLAVGGPAALADPTALQSAVTPDGIGGISQGAPGGVGGPLGGLY